MRKHIRNAIVSTPIFGPIIQILYRILMSILHPFRNSEHYWKNHYLRGGNSGQGSFNALAEFKADVINNFVNEMNIKDVIEFGCGDGNQLKLAKYPSYIGFDISEMALSNCRALFQNDSSKKFLLMSEYSNSHKASLTLSLDVIYHLIEDSVFYKYMENIFDSSILYVMVYSSNSDTTPLWFSDHMKNRNFKNWISKNRPNWKLHSHIANKYPWNGNGDISSISDFYIYKLS